MSMRLSSMSVKKFVSRQFSSLKFSPFDFPLHFKVRKIVVKSQNFHQTHPQERAVSIHFRDEIVRRRFRFERLALSISLAEILEGKNKKYISTRISTYRSIAVMILLTIVGTVFTFQLHSSWQHASKIRIFEDKNLL